MLSQTSRPVIEATLPVIAENIVEITSTFYPKMFAAHPELLDGMFSRANQRSGEQAKALAGSIAAFAQHLLEHPDTLPERVLARIAHKHTSLGILPEQYQIVYENLFAAIVEVLGDAVTPEVAAAWTEVYWLMGDALIKLEEGLYAEQANEKLWMPWRVVSKTPAAEGSVEFVFEPADETPVTASQPGHYVSVRICLPDGLRQARQYSLTSPSGTERAVVIKREDGGEVSPVLVDSVQVGDVVELSNPYGDVVLDTTDAPLVLATAGIGSTPTAPMLDAILASNPERRVFVLHADQRVDAWALSRQTQAAVAALPNAEAHLWLEQGAERAEAAGFEIHDGFMDLSGLQIPADAQWFLCGPLPFMQTQRDAAIAAGVPVTSIRYEVFGPDVWGVDKDAFAAA